MKEYRFCPTYYTTLILEKLFKLAQNFNHYHIWVLLKEPQWIHFVITFVAKNKNVESNAMTTQTFYHDLCIFVTITDI